MHTKKKEAPLRARVFYPSLASSSVCQPANITATSSSGHAKGIMFGDGGQTCRIDVTETTLPSPDAVSMPPAVNRQ